ncbi:MAG: hypothetical protein V2B19_07105 [Pseudomonadota bacterium]
MTDIHDIKPLALVLFPGSFPKSVWYLMAGILVAALLVVAYRYWRNKKRAQDIFPAEVILPPEEAAFQALDALTREGKIPDKAFYFRLSAIFRTYLSGRFGVDGLEMTTEELLPAVDRLGIDRALKSGIKDFLLFSDPVKFADVPAPLSRRGSDLEFVGGFVKQTTPDSAEDKTTGAQEPLTPVDAGKSTA